LKQEINDVPASQLDEQSDAIQNSAPNLCLFFMNFKEFLGVYRVFLGMEKPADLLILKRNCTVDGPFGKTSKIQHDGSGGQQPIDRAENQKLIITYVSGLFKA